MFRRWLGNIFLALNAVVFIAAGILWIRSRFVLDTVNHFHGVRKMGPTPDLVIWQGSTCERMTTRGGSGGLLFWGNFWYISAPVGGRFDELALTEPTSWELSHTREGDNMYGVRPKGGRTVLSTLGFGFNRQPGWSTHGHQTQIWLAIPDWAIMLANGLALTPMLRRRLRQRHRRRHGLCLRCGYNLTGNVSGICPECGTSIQSANAVQGSTRLRA